MTPAARVQAAIEILDGIGAGRAAEQALTGWARRSRFAGSGDRAAVRDHVFDALRRRRSYAALGGGSGGRALMLGAIRAAGGDPDAVFGAGGHAPAALSDAERAGGRDPRTPQERCDMPDWLWPRLVASLGGEADAAGRALQNRAPVHLRVNLARCDRDAARHALADDGIATRPHPASPTALEVTDGARRLRNARAYLDGRVELQDAASQAVVDLLPLKPGMRVLDYCAGGGGKALAMAARAAVEIVAHDASPDRMRDLPARADRAGAQITLAATQDLAGLGPFDLVLCDAPCSGSGSWRRSPEGKWALTEARLAELTGIQRDILHRASACLVPGGLLAYATCSILDDENAQSVAHFLRAHPGWRQVASRSWPVQHGTDGFFSSHLTG
ncbi:RsmB/NOP family class I SAM-dependent RNA methyltransferase [Pukyongiella litopenaei]|uniref:RsmB/NOP family class I SAM-dependent RNA methyltransferase n=1 Tax=Pukyongiella litopenaei TaxID=2605946 RepID=A0A2S0MTX0_9RHOB|nr:RsmB/NOP family class I SAM-dependent RNA methyltransferase [Pukyongiella litopenaei]AVO39247.1 RsmB/NOP family class I SAM-dependent RNA methyltransferase [Pukyongiella litopenaei]